MEFEDLQNIWDTQNDRPVFSMNDSRLAVGLYQQREHSRRRVFRQQFAPIYFTVPLLAVFSAFIFLAFFAKTVTRMRSTDPLMSVWDGVALAIAVVAALTAIVSMHVERKKHERLQNVFAPSLREELEQGISQLDFELSLHSTPRALKLTGWIFLGAVLMVWESGRLNGDPTPWTILLFTLFCMGAGLWYGFATRKRIVDRVMQRKRALESMRAALEENTPS
jgi:amino acid transporter